MEFNLRKENGTLILEPKGTLDANNANKVADICNQWLDQGTRHIVIGMEAVEQISSAGLNSLLNVGRAVRDQEGELVFYGLGSKVSRMFAISGLDALFEVNTSRDDALKSVCNSDTDAYL